MEYAADFGASPVCRNDPSAQPVSATHVPPLPPRCAKPAVIGQVLNSASAPLGPGVVAYVRAYFDDCGTGEFFWLLLCPARPRPDTEPPAPYRFRGECLEFEGQAQIGEVGNMPSPGYRDLRLSAEHIGGGKWYFVRGFKMVGLFGFATVDSDEFLVMPSA